MQHGNLLSGGVFAFFIASPTCNKTLIPFAAMLPFQDQPEAIRAQRVLEVQQRKEEYLWGQLPPGVVDLPGFIHAPKHDDLPKDSQFSDEASRSFHQGRLKGAVNLGLCYLLTLFDSWENLDSFQKIFTGWTGDVPKISQNDLWMEDRLFGYQFLNGCNPCIIEQCNELPSNFPVTNDIVKNVLDRGMTLMEEVKVRKCRRVYHNIFSCFGQIRDT